VKFAPNMGLTPPDALFEKTLSNVEEVMARGGRGVMILGCRGDRPPRRPLCIRHRCAALRILCGAATLMRSRSSCSPITSRAEAH
jgi:hypothetical protein